VGSRIGWDMALAALLLAFALSMLIAWFYSMTYQGLGYLRSFAQTLALGSVVSALVMLAIGDDIARGLGMVGALTMVRFRANLKDTRDLVFIFASLSVGVACGVQAFAVAVCGTAVFLGVVLYVSWTRFGSRREFDAVLRFRLPAEPSHDHDLREVLGRHCRKTEMLDLRASDDWQEYTFHLKLSHPEVDEPALLRDLGAIPGVQDAALLKQDASLEP